MRTLNLEVKKNLKKILATAIVAILFLYFWLNGPLLQRENVINISTHEGLYSIPVMVGENGVNNKGKIDFDVISFTDENRSDYGLIRNKKAERKSWGFIADTKNNPGLSKELRDEIFEHAKQFSEEKQDVAVHPSIDVFYSTISDHNKENIKIYLESTHVVKHIRGYGGEINVGIIIDADGYISRVEHISSNETQSYLADIKNANFYEQFNSVNLSNGEQEIDAVTGATLTTEAITATVSQLITKTTPYPISNYTDIDEVNIFGVNALLNKSWIIHIVVIFLMFFFAMQRWIKKSKKTMLVLTILSVIYLGFFLNSSFTYISFIHPFVGTSVSSFVGLYSLFVLLGAIWGKNTYCKYICPFGNIQKLIIQINPLKTSRKFFIPNKWIKRIRAALTIILLAGVLLGVRSWSNFELFPDLFGLSMLTVWFFVAIVTVLTTMVYPMIWCRLLCPTGSILDGLSDLVKVRKGK